MHVKPHHVTAEQLKDLDKGKCLTYCQWLQTSIMEGILDLLLLFTMDEAWFHLSRHANFQSIPQVTESPHLLHEQPLNDEKVSVWCTDTLPDRSSLLGGRQLFRALPCSYTRQIHNKYIYKRHTHNHAYRVRKIWVLNCNIIYETCTKLAPITLDFEFIENSVFIYFHFLQIVYSFNLIYVL